MNNLVAYSSRNGNTKLIAEEIAKELGCQIINLDEAELETIDLSEIDNLLIGGGVYGGKFSDSLTKFAVSLNSKEFSEKHPVKIAFFVTWLGRGRSDLSAVNACRKLIHSEWINDQDDVLSCLGESFKFIRRGHPDQNDIAKAKIWAGKVVSHS